MQAFVFRVILMEAGGGALVWFGRTVFAYGK
jgi:hypothetical protein